MYFKNHLFFRFTQTISFILGINEYYVQNLSNEVMKGMLENTHKGLTNYKKACKTQLTDEDTKAALEPLKERMKKAESIEQTKLILSHLIDRIEVGDNKIILYLKFSVPQNTEAEKSEEICVEPFVFNSSISRKAIETYKTLNQEAYVSPDIFKTRLKSFNCRN